MLVFLRVKGFAIIDEIQVDFDDGFNVITGETGAGKSIIINALSTLINQRVSADMIKSAAKSAEITAHFINRDKEYILKRIISASGRSRAFLNDEPITLSRMEELGSDLINIYGQNEYQNLLDKERYTYLIDSILNLDEIKRQLSEGVRQLKDVNNGLRMMKKEIEGREKEIALLEFQLDEIERSSIKEQEEEQVRERLKVLRDAERIKQVLEEIKERFYEGDGSVHNVLVSSLGLLKTFYGIDFLDNIKDRIESVSFDIEDIFRLINEASKGLSDDPDELKRLEERLSIIFNIKDKYGKTYEDIKIYEDNAKNRLRYLKALSEDIEGLEKKRDDLQSETERLARELSDSRKAGAPKIEKAVISELNLLAMKKTEFSIEIKDKGTIEEDGKDDIEFLISTNPGEALKPLRRIASGGELSRIMLAIKKVMGGDEEKTLIFDEIDTGIGGMVADMVGQRLKGLSGGRQIICITHLPQIAVYGDSHFLVEKHQKKDTTITYIKRLSRAQRVDEIARMLGSAVITEKTIQRSEEMLNNAEKSFN